MNEQMNKQTIRKPKHILKENITYKLAELAQIFWYACVEPATRTHKAHYPAR